MGEEGQFLLAQRLSPLTTHPRVIFLFLIFKNSESRLVSVNVEQFDNIII
jgi:hypothetical protein